MEWEPHDCPRCSEPSIQPMSVVSGRRHYRCHECLWSWHTQAETRDA